MPKNGHSRLRLGRVSSAGAVYFLTFCTGERKTGLDKVTPVLCDHALALEEERLWRVRCLVVMNDHIHLLIELTEAATLAEVVRRFRGRSSVVMRHLGLQWQKGYFDHRMRYNESLLPVFSYVFLNPYRAGLVPTGERWPGYFCSEEDWAWFGGLTKAGCPLPEWLA